MENNPDFTRELGVIEAMTSVSTQCPHAGIRTHAEAALRNIAELGAEAIPQQAFLVLSTISGWRGSRAEQVKRSLRNFLKEETQEQSS